MGMKVIKTASNIDFFSFLPKELYLEIASHLPIKDIWSLYRINKLFYFICEADGYKIEKSILLGRICQLRLTAPSNQDIKSLRKLFQRALSNFLPLFIAKEPKFTHYFIQWAADNNHQKLLEYIFSADKTPIIQCRDFSRSLGHLQISLSFEQLNPSSFKAIQQMIPIWKVMIQENSHLISSILPKHLGKVLKVLAREGKEKSITILIKRNEVFAKISSEDLGHAIDAAIESNCEPVVEAIIKSNRIHDVGKEYRWNAFFFLRKQNNPLSNDLFSSFEHFNEKNFILTLYDALLKNRFKEAVELTNNPYFREMPSPVVISLGTQCKLLTSVPKMTDSNQIKALTASAHDYLIQCLKQALNNHIKMIQAFKK